MEINDEWTTLAGHRATITGIALSRGFSLSVSIADDGSGILWDMNTLSYVRSLPRHPNKVISIFNINTHNEVISFLF